MATSIPVGKDLEDRNVIVDPGKERIDAQVCTILGPSNPGGIPRVGTGRNDAGAERLHSKLVISAECIAGVGLDKVQGCACGKEELKWSSNAASERCQSREASSAMVFRGPGR